MRRKWLRSAAGLVGLAWIALAPLPAQGEELGSEAGMGAAAAMASLLYGPAKLVYAGLGSFIAGGAWLFSGGDSDVARPIVNAALRGDYVVTPAHLRGERPLEFIGRDPRRRTLGEQPGLDEGF